MVIIAFINKDSIYVGVINTIGKAGASIYVARRLATDSRRGARLLHSFIAFINKGSIYVVVINTS